MEKYLNTWVRWVRVEDGCEFDPIFFDTRQLSIIQQRNKLYTKDMFTVKPWTPKPGEVCVFRSSNTPPHIIGVIAKFKEMSKDLFDNIVYSIEFDKNDEEPGVQAITFESCAPLQTLIKEEEDVD